LSSISLAVRKFVEGKEIVLGWDLTAVSLQLEVQGLLNDIAKIEWLTDRVAQADRIANFGCNRGRETLALFWALGAHEALGIDIDSSNIDAARAALLTIKQDTLTVAQRLQGYPDDFVEWWNATIPGFLNSKILQLEPIEVFVVGDISQRTKLLSNHYDIAFCQYVLHHVWLDKGKEHAGLAIGEMARVVRSGGTVAACEPIQLPDAQKLDFRPLFEQAGLKLVFTEEGEVVRDADPLFNTPAARGVEAKESIGNWEYREGGLESSD
jgi:hypothetical protein